MRILITGNLGYVGPCVVRQLRAKYPHAVLIGADIGYFAHCVTGVARAPEVLLDAQHFVDIRRFPAGLLAGVEAVVHLAAVSNDPIGHEYEQVTMDVNHRASIDLARLAKAAGVRSFVFASSCSVYGCADDQPRAEKAALNPLTAYARSKVATERDLEALASRNFRVSCLRFATACGVSDRLRLDLVLNDFVASAVASGCIRVLSDGTPWRPLIDVSDMARAIEWAVSRDAASGGNFLVMNAGSEQWNYRVVELAEEAARLVPGTRVSINRAAPPDTRSYRVDFSLFRRLAPRHQPLVELANAIELLRQKLTAMNFGDKEFRQSGFIRLNVLRQLQAEGLLNPSLEWTDTGHRRARGASVRSSMPIDAGRAASSAFR
jgi:nucleoside-diphosphate-sugar epimerase